MSIPFIKRAENGQFYVHWTEGRRSKRQSLATQDTAAAERRFAQWLTLRGQVSATGAPVLSVSELWSVYDERHIEKHVASPATLRYSWANLVGTFGSCVVSEVTPDMVDKYVKGRMSGKLGRVAKSSTVRRELNTLVACLNWCADPRRKPPLLAKADLPFIDLPVDSEPKDRWLTMEEINKMLAAAATLRVDGRMSRGERFLWLALETAARKTAIVELTWDRVDFETGVIHYDVPGQRKTKKRRVPVAISSSLLPVLRRMEREKVSEFVLDNKAEVWASIQIIAERAGLAPDRKKARSNGAKPSRSGVSPHTLRHTAATQMARRGVPLFDIAGVLGNTLAMVEKTYAKHCPDRLRAAVNSISAGTLEVAA